MWNNVVRIFDSFKVGSYMLKLKMIIFMSPI